MVAVRIGATSRAFPVREGPLGFPDLGLHARAIRFILVLVVVNLHILRNVPSVGIVYYPVWGLIAAMVLVDYAVGRSRGSVSATHPLMGAWLLLGILGVVSSLATISVEGALVGLARFWFSFPLLLALSAYVRNIADVVNFARWYVALFTLAILSVPLQIFTGPISWFRDETMRGEFVRYASLLGGLNAAGGSAGVVIVLANLIPGAKKWVPIGLISGSVLIDLSKSGVVSVCVGLLVIAVLNFKRILSLVSGASFLAVAAYLLIQSISVVRLRVESTLISFGVESASGLRNSDSTVGESTVDRLTVLPMRNLEAWWDLAYPLRHILGGGFGMASTALVPSESSLSTMSHNQYTEVLTVFGFVGAALLLSILLWTGRNLSRAVYNPDQRFVATTFLCAFVLLLARYMFANGTLYHPATASILFFCVYAGALLRTGETKSVNAVASGASQSSSWVA